VQEACAHKNANRALIVAFGTRIEASRRSICGACAGMIATRSAACRKMIDVARGSSKKLAKAFAEIAQAWHAIVDHRVKSLFFLHLSTLTMKLR
jgi:hypothetical protein